MSGKQNKDSEWTPKPRHINALCARMRRQNSPRQRPLKPHDALQKLMRRVLESASAEPDLLKSAAAELIKAKQLAKQALDTLHNATERFIQRLSDMRHVIAWVDESDQKGVMTNIEVVAEICEVSPEHIRWAIHHKLNKQTLDEVLRRPGYICSTCGHIHQ